MAISMQNYLLLIVALIILIPVLWGYHRGFLRTVVSLASIVIAMFLVTYLQPYVMEGIQKYTPLETTVDTAIRSVVQTQVKDTLIARTEDAAYALTQGSQSTGVDLGGWKISKNMQNQLLEAMGLPQVLRTQVETAAETTADVFLDNVCTSLTKTVMNTASYLATFLLVFLLIRILYLVTGLIGHIPILHGINKILGGIFGLVEAGVILWVLCQAVTVALPSELGQQILQAINESTILSSIYNTLFAIGSIL